jgi:hypothetical protein
MQQMTYLSQRILGISPAKLFPLAVSFLTAELFFKFGSFALECLAFLALWRVLIWAQDQIFPPSNSNTN